ncbi:hypothetical protein F2Q69_00027234 [Brassica cretica]|uniref:Uncharacterized protein n=1 Tax=Brassica cretica TaxID=69181 RepID=A0A8S9RW81_BRACR|nr:hypothetical protein F2Q69_00027234 [Brassica cretica]
MLKEVTHNKSEGELFLTSMEVMINLTLTEGSKSGFDIFTEIAYGPPTTFRQNSDGCKAVRRNSVGIVQSQTAIQRSYIFVGNGHIVRRNSVGIFRRNSDDIALNRNVVGNSSEYTDELPTTTTYSVTNVRRPWCPSEPPSEFDVFSCSGIKQQILWTAIEINERRTVEREVPSREMRRERTAVERAARIVAA